MQKLALLFFIGVLYYGNAEGQVLPDSGQSVQADSVTRPEIAPVSVVPVSRPPIKPVDTVKVDSLLNKDSVTTVKDTQKRTIIPPVIPEARKEGIKKGYIGKEIFFFVLLALLLIIGLLKQFFPKYFSDLFRVFFRRTLKQRQIYEQMIQTPLPSLLLNIFFVVTGGIYISCLLNYFKMPINDNFWIQSLIVLSGLSGIYLVKYLGLKFTGWLFNIKDPADDYSFIVFMINKVIGIVLLPVIILVLLGNSGVAGFFLIFSWAAIGLLILYRLFLSFQLVHNSVKVSSFHFVIYFIGFEIIPLLLIYRLLLLVF